MKKNKWFYACLGAMAFGMFAFLSVSCSDDDKDEKPEEGEVVVTPEPEHLWLSANTEEPSLRSVTPSI